MTSGVVRRGSTVRRPLGPWTPAVHSLLRHLEEVGFPGGPRVVGIDGDVEVLTFIDGEVAVDPTWEPGRGQRLAGPVRTEKSLETMARLLADYHVAVRGFDPPEPLFRFHPHARRPTELICHGDPGPWNTVYRRGRPVALIDWDSCQPLDPVVDLALAAWAYVPLLPPALLAQAGFPPDTDAADRLRTFVDAYGPVDRGAVVPALQEAKLMSAGRVAFWSATSADAALALDQVAAELRWLDMMTPSFAAALR